MSNPYDRSDVLRWQAWNEGHEDGVSELDALLAENARLVAGLESIEQGGTHIDPDSGGLFYGPGAAQARIVLDGSTRPLERYTEKIAALRAELAEVKKECDECRCPSAQHEQLVSLALKGELAAERAHADRIAEALAPLHKVSLVADALRSYAGYRQQKEGKWTEHDEWLVGRANAIAQALAAHDARRQPATKGGER